MPFNQKFHYNDYRNCHLNQDIYINRSLFFTLIQPIFSCNTFKSITAVTQQIHFCSLYVLSYSRYISQSNYRKRGRISTRKKTARQIKAQDSAINFKFAEEHVIKNFSFHLKRIFRNTRVPASRYITAGRVGDKITPG